MNNLIKKDWNYTLSKNDGKFIFSVMCGTVAQFEVDIELNIEEINKYNNQGEVFLDKLAERIRNNPSDWGLRKIN